MTRCMPVAHASWQDGSPNDAQRLHLDHRVANWPTIPRPNSSLCPSLRLCPRLGARETRARGRLWGGECAELFGARRGPGGGVGLFGRRLVTRAARYPCAVGARGCPTIAL